jgi:hypothetical protein
MDRLTYEQMPVCWLSGFVDWTRTGAVASCHIVDQVLLRYDPSYRLNLRVDLHALFDSRTITVRADGSISTTLADDQLTTLGLNRASSLPRIVMTDSRIKALQERITDHDQFVLAKGLAMHTLQEKIVPKLH